MPESKEGLVFSLQKSLLVIRQGPPDSEKVSIAHKEVLASFVIQANKIRALSKVEVTKEQIETLYYLSRTAEEFIKNSEN